MVAYWSYGLVADISCYTWQHLP